jgi:hypothetical protein
MHKRAVLSSRNLISRDSLRVADDWDLRGRVPLEQSEMVGILGLQRAHQNLKSW